MSKLAIDEDEEVSELEQQIIEEIRAGNSAKFLEQVKAVQDGNKAIYSKQQKTILKKRQAFDTFLEDKFNDDKNIEDYA